MSIGDFPEKFESTNLSGDHFGRETERRSFLGDVSCVGLYDHFNTLRFKQARNLNACSAAHVVVSSVSSHILKGRLLKLLLDHPVNIDTEGCHHIVSCVCNIGVCEAEARPRKRLVSGVHKGEFSKGVFSN